MLDLEQATEAADGGSGEVRQAVNTVVDVAGHCELAKCDRPVGQWLTKAFDSTLCVLRVKCSQNYTIYKCGHCRCFGVRPVAHEGPAAG